MSDTALKALKITTDALIWASGSRDFAPGGTARKGWLKVGKPALDTALIVIKGQSGKKRG